MTMRNVFGTTASGAQRPGGDLDGNYNDMGQLMGTTQCSATGTNAITLTPAANQPNVSSPLPANMQMFSFVAAANSTGAVTAQVGSGSFVLVFMPGAVRQAGQGDITASAPYTVMFLTALNSGSGGFVILSAGLPQEQINAQTGVSYTVLQSDQGKLLTFTNAGAIAVTLPQATAAFGAGWWADFKCLSGSVGAVTITPTTSTIDGASTLVLTFGQSARVISDGTNYQIIRTGAPTLSLFTNALSGDVALNNVANYFDGPSIAQGAIGTWWVSGGVTVADTAGTAIVDCKLWDGTTVIQSGEIRIQQANTGEHIVLSGFLAAPAGNLRISCKSNSTTSFIKFNISANSKDSTISAFKVA